MAFYENAGVLLRGHYCPSCIYKGEMQRKRTTCCAVCPHAGVGESLMLWHLSPGSVLISATVPAQVEGVNSVDCRADGGKVGREGWLGLDR